MLKINLIAIELEPDARSSAIDLGVKKVIPDSRFSKVIPDRSYFSDVLQITPRFGGNPPNWGLSTQEYPNSTQIARTVRNYLFFQNEQRLP